MREKEARKEIILIQHTRQGTMATIGGLARNKKNGGKKKEKETRPKYACEINVSFFSF